MTVAATTGTTATDTTQAGTAGAGTTDAGGTTKESAGASGAGEVTKDAGLLTAGTTTENGKDEGTKSGEPAKATEGDQAEITFKLPDGVAKDEALSKEFTTIAKELKLNSEGAQKIVDVYSKAQSAATQKVQEAWKQQNTEWVEASKTDKEFGGEKFDANVLVAKQALEKFGTPALKELLDQYGLGNHPEMLRAFYRAGKAMAEDRVAGTAGASGASGKTSEEQLYRDLYPNTPQMFAKE